MFLGVFFAWKDKMCLGVSFRSKVHTCVYLNMWAAPWALDNHEKDNIDQQTI